MPDAGVSSVVDNIILLNFVELGDQLHRAMTVVKARGSAQSLVTREYQIGPGPHAHPLPDETLPPPSRLGVLQSGEPCPVACPGSSLGTTTGATALRGGA